MLTGNLSAPALDLLSPIVVLTLKLPNFMMMDEL
jgi:hypothetical protein